MQVHGILVCADNVHYHHLHFGDDQDAVPVRLAGIDVTVCYVDTPTPLAFYSFVTTNVFLRILKKRLRKYCYKKYVIVFRSDILE